MSYPFLSLAAGIAVSAAAPAQAAPASAAPQQLAALQAPATARPAQQQPTRANLVRSAESNFQAIDSNNDRSLSATEIVAAQARARQQAMTTRQTRIAQEFTKLDTDRNGQLSLAEFRAAAAPMPAPPANAGATAVQRLDANKDGKVSVEEFRAPILARFDRIDTNKDGTISADERTKAAAARTANR